MKQSTHFRLSDQALEIIKRRSGALGISGAAWLEIRIRGTDEIFLKDPPLQSAQALVGHREPTEKERARGRELEPTVLDATSPDPASERGTAKTRPKRTLVKSGPDGIGIVIVKPETRFLAREKVHPLLKPGKARTK